MKTLSADEVLRIIESDPMHEIDPTDKDYKVYVRHGPAEARAYDKAYFSDPGWTVEAKEKFVELYNRKVVRLGYPGYFYVPPFFMIFRFRSG